MSLGLHGLSPLARTSSTDCGVSGWRGVGARSMGLRLRPGARRSRCPLSAAYEAVGADIDPATCLQYAQQQPRGLVHAHAGAGRDCAVYAPRC